jgi:hypothetical protein
VGEGYVGIEGEATVHVRFAPNGAVSEIGARPPGMTPQEWFNTLSRSCADCYRALPGGRGLFKIESRKLIELQTHSKAD